MTGKAEKAEHEVVCSLCGKTFRTASTTTKRCQECRDFIRRGMRDGHRKVKKERRYVTPQDKIDEMAARAAALGMSYGQYSGIKRAGGHPSPRNREHYTDPAWQAWKDKIYGIVRRQQARVEAERRGVK